jgi:FAD:protein FMN transferase
MTEPSIGTDTFDVFGTAAVLLVTSRQTIRQARSIADRELAAIDLACSRFRPDSELTSLNATAGEGAQAVTPLFADVLAAALRAARLTGGDVDPTCGRALADLGYDRDFPAVRDAPAPLPSLTALPLPVPGWQHVHLDRSARKLRLDRGVQLDLGATAKAWAADRCAGRIAAKVGCGVLVSLGGDIAVAGPAPSAGWYVRITDDHATPASEPGHTVRISTGGLATSSTSVRTWLVGGRPVHHIIDPATGAPARSCWRTVSVAAGSCTDANMASTAAIVRAAAAPSWLHDSGLPARLVRTDGTVETTAGWPDDDGPGNAA